MSFETSENHNEECRTDVSEEALPPEKAAISFSLGRSPFSTPFIPSSFTSSSEVDPQHSLSTKEESSLGLFGGKSSHGTQHSILTVSSELHSGSGSVEEAKGGGSSSIPSRDAARVAVSPIPFPYPPQRSEKPFFYPPHRPPFHRTPDTSYPPSFVTSSAQLSSSTGSLRSSLIASPAAESSEIFRPSSTFSITDHAVMSTSPVVDIHSMKIGSSDLFPFSSTSLEDSRKMKHRKCVLWNTTDTSMSSTMHQEGGGKGDGSQECIADSSVREEGTFPRVGKVMGEEDRRRFTRGQRSTEMPGFVRSRHRALQKSISESDLKSGKEASALSFSTGCPSPKKKEEERTTGKFSDFTTEEKASVVQDQSSDHHGPVSSTAQEWCASHTEGEEGGEGGPPPWVAVLPSSHSPIPAEGKAVASNTAFPPSIFLLPLPPSPEPPLSPAIEEGPPSVSRIPTTYTASVAPSASEEDAKVGREEVVSLPSTAPQRCSPPASFSSASASVAGTKGVLLSPHLENEEERLRGVQRQWHYLSIIENGGREPIAPTMKASAILASSAGEKLKIARPSPQASSLLSPSFSSPPCSSVAVASAFEEASPTRTSTAHPLTASRGVEREAVVVKLAEEEEDTDDECHSSLKDRTCCSSCSRSRSSSSSSSVVQDDPNEEDSERSRERQEGKETWSPHTRGRDGAPLRPPCSIEKRSEHHARHSLSKTHPKEVDSPHVSPPSFSHRKFLMSIGRSAPLLHRRRISVVGSIPRLGRLSYDGSSSPEVTPTSPALSPLHHGRRGRGDAMAGDTANGTEEKMDRPRGEGSSSFEFFSAMPFPSSSLSSEVTPHQNVSSFPAARRRSDISLRGHELGRKQSFSPQKYSKRIGYENSSSPPLSHSLSTSSFSRKRKSRLSHKVSWTAVTNWHRKRKEMRKEGNEMKEGGAEEERFSPRYVTTKSHPVQFSDYDSDSFLKTRSPNAVVALPDRPFSRYSPSPRKGVNTRRNEGVSAHSYVDPQHALGRREIHFEMVDDADLSSSTSEDENVHRDTDDALGRSKRGADEDALSHTQSYAHEEEEGIGRRCPTVMVEKMTVITPYAPSAASSDRFLSE